MVEQGPNTEGVLAHVQPGQFAWNLSPSSLTVKWHNSLPTAPGGGSLSVPAGNCVGGGDSTDAACCVGFLLTIELCAGSSINFMQYNQPAKSDFDAWETQFDNVGWGSRDMLPLLRKV